VTGFNSPVHNRADTSNLSATPRAFSGDLSLLNSRGSGFEKRQARKSCHEETASSSARALSARREKGSDLRMDSTAEFE
jgi:hypothetical protein